MKRTCLRCLAATSVAACVAVAALVPAGQADAQLNYPPAALDDAYATDAGTPLAVAAPGVLANDSDPDGDPIGAVLVTGPANGSVTLSTDGAFTYTPAPGFVGVDSLSYCAFDTRGAISCALVTIVVGVADADGDGIPDVQDPDSVATVVAALSDSVFSTGEHARPILNKLEEIEATIAAGDLGGARTELENLRRKVDGCGATADTNDWIVDCAAQRQVRGLIDALLAELGG